MMILKVDQVPCVECDWLGDWRCDACGVGLCGRHRIPHYQHNFIGENHPAIPVKGDKK